MAPPLTKKIPSPNTFTHYFKNVAEHLDLNRQGILELMNQSRQWFIQKELPPPTLYVPAVQICTDKKIAKTSFRQIEVTRGLIHLSQNKSNNFSHFH